jgi:tetratricopeptide (TPR) repeat protein
MNNSIRIFLLINIGEKMKVKCLFLLLLFWFFSCASQKSMISEKIEEGDAAELLSNLSIELKSKNNVIDETEISNLVTTFDSLCDKNIIVSKTRDLVKLTGKIERISYLDSILLDHAKKTKNNRLATSLREIKFRTLVKTQERMEEAFNNKGNPKGGEVHASWKFDKQISRMIPYVQANQKYSTQKSLLLFDTIESLSKMENVNKKKRCWIAIERMINEIDIKNSETGYRPFQNSASGIITQKGKIVEAIKGEIKKETNLEIIVLSNKLLKTIERDLSKTDDNKTKARLQLSKELDKEFKKQMAEVPVSDNSNSHFGLAASDWFDKGYFTEDNNLKTVFYTKAIDLNPNYTAAFNNRGNAYQKLGKTKEAILDYSRTIHLQPGFAPAYLNRGNIFLNFGDFEKAIQDYSKAIDLDPKNKLAFNFRANCYKKVNKFDQAFEDYNKAIKLDPNNATVYLDRADVYRESGMDKKAIQDCNQAIKLNTDIAQAFNKRGMSYKNLGMYKESIENYKQAIEIKPNFAAAFYNIGCTYWELKDWKKVINAWEKCLELQPDNDNASKWLAKAKARVLLENYRKQLDLK